MSDKINLKALERKAYLAYYEDGLLDMGIGACTIYNTGKIRLIDLQRAGYKVKVCLH
ncbi:hypothetical protein HOJ44_09840 [Candidatus Bathyarchaeota archaeon]|nr:hypothetical protein [Candidatus Bathyarchaeota archaeon]